MFALSLLIRKIKTAFRMPLRDAFALALERSGRNLHRWGVVLRQETFCIPKNKRRLIVYLTPGEHKVNGGVMSIYNQATSSRKIIADAAVVLSTYPKSPYVYATNKEFPNDEKIRRWSQISRLIQRFPDVMIHVPDCYVEQFYDDLKEEEKVTIRSHPRLSINIMDQNILLMPAPNKVDRLRSLASRVTQTCAHAKYAGQEFANKFNLPTIWLPAILMVDCYKKYPYAEKERRIVYSPDEHPRKQEILNILKNAFADFEFYEVRDIPFPRFMDVVSRSLFSITFGEGVDGYFSLPLRQCSMSFAVYNSDFFSNEYDYAKVWNVFASYDDMSQNIVLKMKECLLGAAVYDQRVCDVRDALPYLETTDDERSTMFFERLQRFYKNDFDYYPGGKRA